MGNARVGRVMHNNPMNLAYLASLTYKTIKTVRAGVGSQLSLKPGQRHSRSA